jgi:hypothetical protein
MNSISFSETIPGYSERSLTRSEIRMVAVVVSLVLCLSGCGKDQGTVTRVVEEPPDLSVGRMRVAIWPEYDDRSMLVIYDGKLETGSSFPLETSFLIPRGALINDACSLSYDGQHFCQLYKTTNKGEYDEVRLTLPYPNFYLSFHTQAIDVEAEKRTLEYRIKASHPISTMEVDIQQPLRSTAFDITPPTAAASTRAPGSVSIVKGFNHFAYKLDDIPAGEQNVFAMKYVKRDPNPSVDIKYASMDGPRVWGSPYETQRHARTFVYALFGSGLLGVAAVLIWLIRVRKTKQRGNLS